jgi:Cdc6-like AAA superfamily ATPase
MSYQTNKISDNYLYAPLPLWFLYLYFIKRSWLHCNPSNSLINDQKVLKHYFFENEKIIFKNKDNNKIHSIIEFDSMKNIFFDDDFKLVFLYGNKGYGKTTIQNYLLMKYTKELNKNGLTWLRVDVSKIYREWQGFNNITLINYLYTQIVYVYIRYYKNVNNNSCDDIFKNQFKNIESKLKEKGIYETFKKFEKKLVSSQNCVQHSKMEKKHIYYKI